MKVINETKDTVISEDANLLVSAFSKAIGLMFRRKAKPLVFLFRIPRKVSLHMWFVFCTIDALFVDSHLKVVDVKENLKPWRVYKSAKKCRYVIEVPSGVLKASKTSIGDEISFSDIKKNI